MGLATSMVMEKEYAERREVIRAAREWYGTPFHNNQALKGAGCDCLGLIIGVYSELGIRRGVEIPKYTAQHHLHQKDELYLSGFQKYLTEVTEPGPGDLALFKFGKCYSHAGIVVRWPIEMIHSYATRGVELVNPEIHSQLSSRIRSARFFTPWGEGKGGEVTQAA